VGDAAVEEKCPETPITTRAEFEKVWKALRGAEEMPKVEFAKEFVLVRTSTVGKVTAIELSVVEGEEEVDGSVSITAKAGEKTAGLSYGIVSFRRELVDVVDGRIKVKVRKK
jgi:hypothetical protein